MVVGLDRYGWVGHWSVDWQVEMYVVGECLDGWLGVKWVVSWVVGGLVLDYC